MKKQELLKQFDDDLLDRLFGFCYARTNDSYEAQELCSDIIFALVKAAHTDGEITNMENGVLQIRLRTRRSWTALWRFLLIKAFLRLRKTVSGRRAAG